MRTLSIDGGKDSVELPNELYVLLGGTLGRQYNDCTYDYLGEYLHTNQYYTSKKEALKNYSDTIKSTYGDMRIYEVYDLMNNTNHQIVHSALTSEGSISYDENEMTVSDAIMVLEEYYSADSELIYSVFNNFLKIVKLEK